MTKFIVAVVSIQELDTHRSMFNDENLWITVIVRSTTSTKTCFAVNMPTLPGMVEPKNQHLHWFEGS
jgi:hypothetical protein